MKNKNPWNLLRCINITPWYIPLGEQRFVFFEPPNDPDIPDGGVADPEAGAETDTEEDADAADVDAPPVDPTAAMRAAAQQSVETGQEGLLRNAALTHESSQQYLRRIFESLPQALQDDQEVQDTYLDANSYLDSARTVDDRMAIIEELQSFIDHYDLPRYAPTAPAAGAEEPPPPPVDEAEDGPPVVPPETEPPPEPILAPTAREAAPRKPTLTPEKRADLTLAYINNTIGPGKKGISAGSITEAGFRDVFGKELKGDKKALHAAVIAKQRELNKDRQGKKQPVIAEDGILGPETYQALVDAGLTDKLKIAPAAPSGAVADAPAAAPVPAAETAREAAPPKVTQLPNFPEYKAPPSLPEFYEEGFYTIEVPEFLGIDLGTTSEDQLKKWGVEEGAVVYVRSGDPAKGKAITVETVAGRTFNIDGGNLEPLGNNDEKRTIYMGQRYELLSGAAQRDYLPKIDTKNVRSYQGQLVCIDRDTKSPGPGLVVVKYSDGTIETNGVPQSELEEVSQQDKYAYLVETYDNLDHAMRGNVLPVDRAAYQEAISRTPADTQKRKGLAESAPLEIKVARDCPLFYVDSRGKIWTVTKGNEFVRAGAKVSVLGKTTDGKYLQVATADGFTGFIETSRTDGNIVAKAKLPVAPAVAAAPAPPPAPAAAVAAPAPAPPGAAPPPPTGATHSPVVPPPAAPPA